MSPCRMLQDNSTFFKQGLTMELSLGEYTWMVCLFYFENTH